MSIPGSASPLFLSAAAAAAPADYEIERSLRFNSADSAYLNRTPSSAGNRKTWTWAGWVKTNALGSEDNIFTSGSGANFTYLTISDNIGYGITFARYTGSHTFRLSTTRLFRDPSAWYHIVLAVDTSQATDVNRVKLYINGIQETVFTTAIYPGLNSEYEVNNTNDHRIGARTGNYAATGQFDGYLADVHFIDGQALAPTDFGQYDSNNVWQPKDTSGLTFGTNGFHLDFSDNSSNAALGDDSSGNNNDWTVNNLSVATGGPISVAAATGALPIHNTTDTYGTVKGTGTRTDVNSSSLVLAIPMDGTNGGTTFSDLSATIKGSGSAKSITVTNATTTTTESKFYGSSGDFTATNPRLSLSDSADYAFGSGNFTIETWIYKTSGGIFFGQGNGSSPAFVVYDGSVYIGPTIWTANFSFGTTPNNEWFHFALVRNGNTLTVYINGVSSGTLGYSSSWPDSTDGFTINESRNTYMTGSRFQDFRIYKGVAKYTSNFNPPTETVDSTIAAGNDSLVDSPTNGTQTDTGAGGEVVGNYATLNPLASDGVTLSNGNLDASISTSDPRSAVSTVSVSSGKWYAEVTYSSGNGEMMVGVVTDQYSPVSGTTRAHAVSSGGGSVAYFATNGDLRVDTANSSYGATYTTGDVIGIALNLDDDEITFYKNGASQGAVTSKSFTGGYTIFVSNGGGNATQGASLNFGQRAFAYTAPSGFKALCTANLTDPTIADGSTAFAATTYTGNGASSRAITGVGHSPDFFWVKSRGAARPHNLQDSVRGVGNYLISNATNAEGTGLNDGLISLDSDGFTIGNNAVYNNNNEAYVAWTWDGGTSTVTNTDGSLTATLRANPSAGFSIISNNTGTSSGSQSIGHGLNAKPGLVIVKRRDVAENWFVWHESFAAPTSNYLKLNSTDSVYTGGASVWGAGMTSSVVGITANAIGGDNIIYVFAPVAGYSAFGSYTGNGSTDGPFVYTGFRPRWIMFKNPERSDSPWVIHDTAREAENVMTNSLEPNTSDAEDTQTERNIDALSNGFKIRGISVAHNNSAHEIIYAAFAEHPFKTARAR